MFFIFTKSPFKGSNGAPAVRNPELAEISGIAHYAQKSMQRLAIYSFAILSACSLTLHADFIDFQSGASLVEGSALTGSVTSEGWNQLNTERINNDPLVPGDNTTRPYGSHNLQNAWSASIASNVGSEAGDSSLFKSSGYGYIAGSSLHQGLGGNDIIAGGNFSITSTSISGIETLVFQIQATDRGGSSTVLGSIFDTPPTLSFGTDTVSATYSALYDYQLGYSAGFGGQNMQSHAFQWDLGSYDIEEGTELTINWVGLTNSGIFGLQVNQADTFTQVVPEPSSWMLMLVGLGILLHFKRSRKHVAA